MLERVTQPAERYQCGIKLSRIVVLMRREEEGFISSSMDHLFDRGFISFENSGLMIVSPVADAPSLNRMGVTTDRVIDVGMFTQGQQHFLDYHRVSVLLQARH